MLARRQVHAHLDAAQRQQIVDQPRHALGLARHDVEEALARLRRRRAPAPAASRRSRAARRAACAARGWRWRRNRRASATSRSCSVRSRNVMSTCGEDGAADARQARHGRRHAPLHRHALDELDVDALLRRQRPIDGRQQIGAARHLAHRLAGPDLGKQSRRQARLWCTTCRRHRGPAPRSGWHPPPRASSCGSIAESAAGSRRVRRDIASMMAPLSSGHVAGASSSRKPRRERGQSRPMPRAARAQRECRWRAATGIQRAASRRLAASHALPAQASASALRSAQRTLLNAVPRDIFGLCSGPFANAIAAR